MAAGQYAAEQIEEYEQNKNLWMERADGLLTTILSYDFKVERAGEFARTGFGRRLGYLEHAMRRMGEVYPPNCSGASREQVRDAELILQAFVMNVFGAIDNLAWIWALERGVIGARGGSSQVCRDLLCWVAVAMAGCVTFGTDPFRTR
jgi:hypothetical protein